MFFTEQDFKRIKAWLDTQSVKDSSFPEGRVPFTGSEELPMLQDGKNVRLNLIKALNTLMPFRSSDFINISNVEGFQNKYTLTEAIQSVLPVNRRKGAVITFTNKDNMWVTYQFRSDNIDNWSDLTYWKIFETNNPFKGFFEDIDTLNSVFPKPNEGDYAYVGPTLEKAYIYRCNKVESRWERVELLVNDYRYCRVVTPDEFPSNGDNYFYIALLEGNYTNFGNLQVNKGITILKKVENNWVKEELLEVVQTKGNEVTGGSTSAIMSQKAVTDELNKKTDSAQFEVFKEFTKTNLESHDKRIINNLNKIEENRTDINKHQEQIDALINRSDVVDVVENKAALDAYDISTITIKDIIKVLKDETKDNAITYYKLTSIDPKEWQFIGALGEYYTKAESDTYRQETQAKLDEKFDKTEAIIAEDWNKEVQDLAPTLATDALRKTPQDLTEDEKRTVRANIGVGEGAVIVPDEEDLTKITKGNIEVLKFKDKEYSEPDFSGLGRVYLRKNIKNGKNILEQSMINKPNTIYIIQYDYDLGSTPEVPVIITIPENCVLKFEGGSFSNGTIDLNNCQIIGTNRIFDAKNINIIGKTSSYPQVDWFIGEDWEIIEKAIKDFKSVQLTSREYHITRDITIKNSFQLKGNGFPDFFGSYTSPLNINDYSQTQIIAEKGVTNIFNILSEDRSKGSPYHSIVIDSVSFVGNKNTNKRISNGIYCNTVGGPSMPIIVKNCNFTFLDKGIFVENPRFDTGTVWGDFHIYDCDMHSNNYGIYGKGISAFVCGAIENNRIVQNLQGGIYLYDNREEVGRVVNCSLIIRCNDLEGQPAPITIKAGRTTVDITDNYFESTSYIQEVYVSGDYSTFVHIKGNFYSNEAERLVYKFFKCQLDIEDSQYTNYPQLEVSTCIILNNDISYLKINQSTKIYDGVKNISTPTYITDWFTGEDIELIKDGIALRQVPKDGYSDANLKYLKAGRYIYSFYIYTPLSNNPISSYWSALTCDIYSPSEGLILSKACPFVSGKGLCVFNVEFKLNEDYDGKDLFIRLYHKADNIYTSVGVIQKIENDFNNFVVPFIPIDNTIKELKLSKEQENTIITKDKIYGWNGIKWITSEGYPADAKTSGFLSERPNAADVPPGFTFMEWGESNVYIRNEEREWNKFKIIPQDVNTEGPTANRPALDSGLIKAGFAYFDTDLDKVIYKSSKGNKWIFADGTDVPV